MRKDTESHIKKYITDSRRKRTVRLISAVTSVAVFCATYVGIVPRMYAEESGVLERLNGDFAHINNFTMTDNTATESGQAIASGAGDFDSDDSAGNDSSAVNNIIRTYDLATYTMDFSITLNGSQPDGVIGYKQGRLYYEFVLPLNEEQAVFETDSMKWLETKPESAYETAEVGYTPVLSVFKGKETENAARVWDGTQATDYARGSGTSTNPYIIETAEQLARLVNDDNTAGNYYKLTKNIVLNESLTESSRQWYSVAYKDGSGILNGAIFQGHLDGGGHTVSGLYFNGSSDYPNGNPFWYAVGLFPRVDAGAVIENVGVINSSITLTGSGHAGAIVGVYSPSSSSDSNSLTIKNCFADESVSITSYHAGGIAGALNGAAYIYDSYFTGRLSGNNRGAIYVSGWTQSTHIYRFYSTSALLKHNNETYEENSVYSTAGNIVSLDSIKGSAAESTLAGFDFKSTWSISKGQVLRGSFLLTTEAGQAAIIGSSQSQLTAAVRVKTMKNGQKITPSFTLWLEHNDVGTTYKDGINAAGNTVIDAIPLSLVTDGGKQCSAHSKTEYKTVKPQALTISAAPAYNAALASYIDNRTISINTYDFSTGKENAPNKDAGKVMGRMMGIGLKLELTSKHNNTLLGVELPDEGTEITFDITLDSSYKTNEADGYTNITAEYTPLLWEGQANTMLNPQISDSTVGRDINTQGYVAFGVPYNGLPQKEGGVPDTDYEFSTCQNGGSWEFTVDGTDKTVLHVKVTGFKVDLKTLPYTNAGAASTSYDYYNPSVRGADYWRVSKAVFSSGKMFFVQPYKNSQGIHIMNRYNSDSSGGTVQTKAAISNFAVKTPSGETTVTQQTADADDRLTADYPFVRPGNINTKIAYVPYDTKAWDKPLTDGCLETNGDWGSAGQNIGIMAFLSQEGSEGIYAGIAYDLLIKFDDAFFDYEDYYTILPNDFESEQLALDPMIAYKKDKNGWNHKGLKPDQSGYDDEMIVTRADELIYFPNKSEAEKEGYHTPVGFLFQLRGVPQYYDGGTNHFRFYLKGKIKADCEGNYVYMTTCNARVWTMNDVTFEQVSDAWGGHLGEGVADKADLTVEHYSWYAKSDKMPQLNKTRSNRGTIENNPRYVDGSYNNVKYPVASYTKEPNVLTFEGLTTSQKASYDSQGVYNGGSGALDFIDSCLVVTHAPQITKTTAQKNGENSKTAYDMDKGERVADYILSPSIKLSSTTGNTGSTATATTTVYIEDTIDPALTYIGGTAYIGGTYTQDSGCVQPGTVTGGARSEPQVTSNEDGTTTLKWMLENVTIDLSETTNTLPPIYYSCTIGAQGDEDKDVTNQQRIKNTVKIHTSETTSLPINEQNRNTATASITTVKLSTVALSKVADKAVIDRSETAGFTMSVTNSSNTAETDTIIVEQLPLSGYFGSNYNGYMLVKSLSVLFVGDTSNQSDIDKNNTLISGLKFYYATKANEIAGQTSTHHNSDDTVFSSSQYLENIAENTIIGDGRFTELTFASLDTTEGAYHCNNLPSDEYQKTSIDFIGSDGSEKYPKGQITTIAIRGDLPANTTLKLHITLEFPEAKSGDTIINHFSYKELEAYAKTSVVQRSVEGVVWMDADSNGIRGNEEELTDGVKVTLLKLKSGGSPSNLTDYKEVTDNNGNSVTALTGKSVDVLDGATTAYEKGRYKFTNLIAGIYAVKFEDGNTAISGLIASPSNIGADEIDSDGIAVYTSDRSALSYTYITGIEMPPAENMQVLYYESKYNDSGFYERGYELPTTGGSGTAGYTAAGITLWGLAAIMYVYNRRKSPRK